MESLDIVIPVRNSESSKNNSIFFTIRSILGQVGVKSNIYIVDDGSTDKTVQGIRNDFKEVPDIHILQQQHLGIAHARNLGASKGCSAYLLFIDDDTILSSVNTLEETIKFYSKYDFACGAYRYWTPLAWHEHLFKFDTLMSWYNILNKIAYEAKGVDRNTGYMDLTHITFIGNYGLVKRKVFEENGGYPILYDGWGMEDTHLMYQLCIKGYSYGILRDQNLKVFHLNHKVDKNESFLRNLGKFQAYQREVGLLFSEAAFFNEFDGVVPVLRSAVF